jgi:hypothetical protein
MDCSLPPQPNMEYSNDPINGKNLPINGVALKEV